MRQSEVAIMTKSFGWFISIAMSDLKLSELSLEMSLLSRFGFVNFECEAFCAQFLQHFVIVIFVADEFYLKISNSLNIVE